MAISPSWKNWFGYVLEDDAESPYADTPGTGSEDNVPTNFIPLAGAESLRRNDNRLYSPGVTGISAAPMAVANGAQIVTGTVPLELVPDVFGAADEGKLYDWALARTPDETDDYWQTRSATVWIKLASFYYKKIIGCKISRMTIEAPEGGSYASLSLDIIGQQESIVTGEDLAALVAIDPSETVSTIYTSIYGTGCPVPAFTTQEAGAYFSTVTSNATVDALFADSTYQDEDVLSWSVVVDNKIDEGGHRVNESSLLRRLYSTGREVTATFSRDLTDTTHSARRLANTNVVAGFRFVRSTEYLAIVLPRASYEEGGPVSEGTRESFNKESYTLRALGECVGGPNNTGDEIVFSESTTLAGSS
jgi:hypothetical protein